MYAASISAGELLKWCDVPKATADSGGYQRALNEGRQDAIAAYVMQDEKNLLPGAVIVAVDKKRLQVEEIQGTDGAFELTITDDSRQIETKLAEYLAELKVRLKRDPNSASAPGAGDDDVESPSDRPSSHLASIAERLESAHGNWERLEADDPEKKEITEYVEGATKRDLIIDGQHRVYGAKVPEERAVELPVILVPGLKHAEQAFQFYVLNNTAKPLNQTQLRRIVATSLTNPEIEDLYHRFHQSGLKTEDALWTYKMNTSEDSPFFGRIDFAYEERQSSEVIRENVAFQLVRSFIRLKKSDYESLLGPIAEKWENDDNEYRLKLFFQLWNGISERYEGLWEPAIESAEDDTKQPQIFKKVSLLALQELVLEFETAGFQRANLADTELTRTHFQESTLTFAELGQANLVAATVASSNLSNADATNANLSMSTLLEVEMRNTVFLGAQFTDARFYGLDFSSADMRGVELTGVGLSGVTGLY